MHAYIWLNIITIREIFVKLSQVEFQNAFLDDLCIENMS
jgi:hypothetical protein